MVSTFSTHHNTFYHTLHSLYDEHCLISGRNQYIDLGDLSKSFMENLDEIKATGLTLTFRLKLKRGSSADGQVVLSGNSYDISIVEGFRYVMSV